MAGTGGGPRRRRLGEGGVFYRSRLGLERRLQADGDVGFASGGLTILLGCSPHLAAGGVAAVSAADQAVDAPRLARTAARGVTISDAVQLYDDGYWVGAFPDSEGNKLWFCSEAG